MTKPIDFCSTRAGITVTLPKPDTSGAKSDVRFGEQDFVYLPEEDTYCCPAGERLPYHYTSEEDGKILRRYWTTACQNCALKSQCTTGLERRITRWEHEHLLEVVQQRLEGHRSDTLPHKNASKSSRRNGSIGSGLQSDTVMNIVGSSR